MILRSQESEARSQNSAYQEPVYDADPCVCPVRWLLVLRHSDYPFAAEA